LTTLSERIGTDLPDAYVDAVVLRRREGGDDAVGEAAMEVMTTHLADHLEALVGDGRIVAHTTLPNRRMDLLTSWNVMCGATPPTWRSRRDETMEVAGRLQRAMLDTPLMLLAFDIAEGRIDETGRSDAMRAFRDRLDAGTLSMFEMSTREQDFVSGESLDVELRSWELSFGRRVEWGRAMEPAEDVAPTRPQILEMDAPTGELLVRDWFQDDGFTNLVDEGNPWRGGSRDEDERDAERYARDHGFMSVRAAERSLGVFTRGDRVTIGRHDEDEHPTGPVGHRRRGELTIDLRRVSVIDRGVLEAMLTRLHGEAEGRAIADRLAKDRRTVRLRMRPGRYRFRSSGEGAIAHLLRAGDPSLAPGYEAIVDFELISEGNA
jgi:hypothetical protein